MRYPLDITRQSFVTPAEAATIRHDTGQFKLLAEEDYLLARHCLLINWPAPALSHYAQCIEKIFKAYLAFVGEPFTETHKLDPLREKCAMKGEAYFEDPELKAALVVFLDWNSGILARYPNYLVQQFAYRIPDVLHFLDEFVYTMRGFFNPRVAGENVADAIEMLYLTALVPASGPEALGLVTMQAAFEFGNPFAEGIKAQFSSGAAPVA